MKTKSSKDKSSQVIAEVEQLVEAGQLKKGTIHTPGIYVQKLIDGQQEKRIEKRTITIPDGSER